MTDTPPVDGSDATVQVAVGGYVGVLVAGLVTTAVALTTAPPITVLGTAVAGFLGGGLAGGVLARRIRELVVRIGRTSGRRAALVLPAAPFGAAAGASLVVSLESPFVLVALVSAIAIAISGSVLGWTAGTRYADAITADDPVATWQWDPPGNPKLDAVVLSLWLFLGAGRAVGGEWTGAVVWTGLAILWACSGLAEGRWQVGSIGKIPEIRVYENGLVKQRPYTRSFVPWDDISHVRLREDELVLDRGLFDVRFDRDELSDLEAARTEIERRLSTVAVSS